MGRSLLRALSPRSVPALSLPRLQPLAQMGPSDPERGRNVVFLSPVTALSSPLTLQLMHLSLLP